MPNNGMTALLETLRAIMKDSGAKSRLRDIIPVEISLVDRAANKRRFLTIKNKDGVNTMATLLKVDLPANMREGVEKALATALQQLHTITKAVTEGEAITTEGAQVPEDFYKALGMVLEQLAPIAKEAPSELGTEASDKLKAIAAAMAMIAEADSPDSVTDMVGRLIKLSGGDSKEASTLKALGELSIALSADPMKDGKHAEGTVEKVKALTKTLSDLVSVDAPAPADPPATEPTPAAKTDEPVTPPEPTPAAKTDEPAPAPAAKTDEPAPPPEPAAKTDEPAAPPVADPAPAPAEPTPAAKTDEPAPADPPAPKDGDKVEKALTAIVEEVAKAGAKMSAKRKEQLRGALKAISALMEEVDPPAEPTPAAKVDEPSPAPVTKNDEPVDVLKMVQELNNKVSTLMEKPVAPASRRVEGNPETGTESPVPESPTRRKRRWIA